MPSTPIALAFDLTLPAESSSVPQARHAIVSALLAAGWADCDPAALVATELVSNAARHGLGPISVRCVVGDVLLIGVHDTGPGMPRHRNAAPDDEDDGGRGLLMVDAFAAGWGWYRDPPGKRVWARIPR